MMKILLVYFIVFQPHRPGWHDRSHLSHFTDEEIEVYQNQVTCPGSYRTWEEKAFGTEREVGSKLERLWCQFEESGFSL